MSGVIWRSSSLMRRLSSRTRSSNSRQIAAISPSRSASRAATRSTTCWSLSPRAGISSSGAISCRCQRIRLCRRVRSATRSSRWSTSNLTWRDGPSSWATGRSGSRHAERAIASASIASDLPRVRALRRTLAIICVGTRRTCSPTRNRSASSVRVRCRQSSRAQRRLGHRPAHAIAARCPSADAANVLAASSRPSSSAATSVCVRLCASTPITTCAGAATLPPLAVTIDWSQWRSGGHASVERLIRLL